MRSVLFTSLLLLCALLPIHAEERTIDISGNNTSSDYKSYSTYISLPAQDIVNVKMARYCYFSSTISGSGLLNLYGGGERCYLGTEKGKAWPNWNSFTGDIHIYPFKENSSSAGSYGVLLAHGGKSSSAENALDDAKGGKVNPSMANNHVTLHEGATMTCEANTAGAGFRIGELNTEVGSTLSGYYKKSRAAYYLLGGLNTDFTLAGTIKPTDYDNATQLSIVKEGTGTLSITGNDNYVSGALRVLEGRVLVMNDRSEAASKKLRGALGAKANATEAIAYVFGKGVLGGTGSIGGMVDNYGVIEPGTDAVGLLTLKNYAAQKDANLTGGIKDNDSWRSSSNPLLYTSGLEKKPAWYAVRSALRHRTLNETDIKTLNVQRSALNDNTVYSLDGRRIGSMSNVHCNATLSKRERSAFNRGIVIVNGKKTFIK